MQLNLFNQKKDHVAYLSKSWKMLDKILDGRKTIESRWYVNKVNPWQNVSKGDVVYLKETGDPIRAKADVDDVLFFENLNKQSIDHILNEYGGRICLDESHHHLLKNKKYCILIFLNNVEKIHPFEIDKRGFGIASAWLTVDGIDSLRCRND